MIGVITHEYQYRKIYTLPAFYFKLYILFIRKKTYNIVLSWTQLQWQQGPRFFRSKYYSIARSRL